MPLNDYEWGRQVLMEHQHFFYSLMEEIAKKRDVTTAIRSGQVWQALPEGGYVLLVGKRYLRQEKQNAERVSFAIIDGNAWKVIPDRLPGPCSWEIHFVEGRSPSLRDAEHQRPGLLLCDPHSNNSRSVPLRRFGRAIWTRVQSKPLDRRWCLHVLGAADQSPNRPGSFPFWTAWSISIKKKEGLSRTTEQQGHLLHLTGDLARCTPNSNTEEDLHSHATLLLAELLGVQPFSPRARLPRRRYEKPIPRRGEIVLVHFGSDNQQTPCLVVSPDAFNRAYNDLVVLQCIPGEESDRSNSTVVRLPDSLELRSHQGWSVDLSLVRGIAFADRFFDTCKPNRQYLDEKILASLEGKLKSLYA